MTSIGPLGDPNSALQTGKLLVRSNLMAMDVFLAYWPPNNVLTLIESLHKKGHKACGSIPTPMQN